MEPIRIIKDDMFNIKINKEYKVYLLNSIALSEEPLFFLNFMKNYISKNIDSIKKFYICIEY